MGGDFCFVTPGYQNFISFVFGGLFFYVEMLEVGKMEICS